MVENLIKQTKQNMDKLDKLFERKREIEQRMQEDEFIEEYDVQEAYYCEYVSVLGLIAKNQIELLGYLKLRKEALDNTCKILQYTKN